MSFTSCLLAAMKALSFERPVTWHPPQGFTLNSALSAVAGEPSASAATSIHAPEGRFPAATGTKAAWNGGTDVFAWVPSSSQPPDVSVTGCMQTTPPVGDVT